MYLRIVVISIAMVFMAQAACADMVFFTDGRTMDGKLVEPSPESKKVVIKTQYGEQQFDRSQILTVLTDYEALRVKPRLRSGVAFLIRGKLEEANREFEAAIKINKNLMPKVQQLVQNYYYRRIERFNRVFTEIESKAERAQQLIKEGQLLIHAGQSHSVFKSTVQEWQARVTQVGQYNIAQGERMVAQGQQILAELAAANQPDTIAQPSAPGGPEFKPMPEEPKEKPPPPKKKKKMSMRTIVIIVGVGILVMAFIMKKLQK